LRHEETCGAQVALAFGLGEAGVLGFESASKLLQLLLEQQAKQRLFEI